MNTLDCAVARLVGRPAGFRGKSGRLAAFCAARLVGARVGKLGMSSKFDFEPAGEAERVVRNRGRSWWSSGFSTQKCALELQLIRLIDTAELSEYCDASIWRGSRNFEENGKLVETASTWPT